MLTYVSTRGENTGATYSSIVLRGLADDGGLFVPAVYPLITSEQLSSWRGLSYAELAAEVLKLFASDIDAEDIRQLCANTYRADVYCNTRLPGTASQICPVLPLKGKDAGIYLLELSNGPTLAFKDMAMQFLGSIFEYLLKKDQSELNILGATSGDTGSAAEYAMRGRERIRVFMLSPDGRMSAFQRAQMYSLDDSNIFNIAVRGTFDDAQDVMKAVSNDHAFKRAHHIGTVNSVNWARVAAQVVYYIWGWLNVADDGETIDVTVPSGNFGNICAGWVAKQMGVPIGRLVVATNENDVLHEFFTTGTYRVRSREQTFATTSPSMDISKASNFERYIFDIVGRNSERVRELWAAVANCGEFTLKEEEFERVRASGFVSGRSTHADRLATIADLWKSSGVLIDPHTADGLKVAREQRREGVRMLTLETAQPAKFAETIREAVGTDPAVPVSYRGIESKAQIVTVMDPDAEKIKEFIDCRTLQSNIEN